MTEINWKEIKMPVVGKCSRALTSIISYSAKEIKNAFKAGEIFPTVKNLILNSLLSDTSRVMSMIAFFVASWSVGSSSVAIKRTVCFFLSLDL
jgi:hypothetical protein